MAGALLSPQTSQTTVVDQAQLPAQIIVLHLAYITSLHQVGQLTKSKAIIAHEGIPD
jgi:hypothetical protein